MSTHRGVPTFQTDVFPVADDSHPSGAPQDGARRAQSARSRRMARGPDGLADLAPGRRVAQCTLVQSGSAGLTPRGVLHASNTSPDGAAATSGSKTGTEDNVRGTLRRPLRERTVSATTQPGAGATRGTPDQGWEKPAPPLRQTPDGACPRRL